jgi:hypothetical protein
MQNGGVNCNVAYRSLPKKSERRSFKRTDSSDVKMLHHEIVKYSKKISEVTVHILISFTTC